MLKGTLRHAKKVKDFLKREDKKLGFSSSSPTVPNLVEGCISYLENNGKRFFL